MPKTRTIVPKLVYLRVGAERQCSDGALETFFSDANVLREVVSAALLKSHGTLGAAAVEYQLIHFDAESRTGILRAPVEVKNDLWVALTLLSEYQGRPARIVVSHVSPFLLPLARVREGLGEGI